MPVFFGGDTDATLRHIARSHCRNSCFSNGTATFGEAPIGHDGAVNSNLRVDWLQVWRWVREGRAQLLDSRSPQLFGQGHIPTARNAFLRENLKGEKVLTWRSKDELLARLKALGID